MAELTNDVINNELELTKRNTSLISDVKDSKNPVSQDNSVESQVPASSSYIMMDRSQLSGDVDRWIHGESATPVSTGVQKSSAMANSLEPFFVHLGQICSRIREQFRRLATEHIIQELFSTAMDIILVVYAIGFLLISMYQSSIIE